MSPKTTIVSLICAAGVGSRMKLGHPKQYMTLGNAPMLLHTVRALKRVERIDDIVLVVSPTDPYIDELADRLPDGVRILRCGGRERAESVVNGLIAAAFPRDAWVLVHDAARPCVRPAEVGQLIDAVLSDDSVAGGILAAPVADTIKRADANGRIVQTVPRDDLWRAATPQMFRVHELIDALSGDLTGVTDEASAMERLGRPVRIVRGRTTNIKVTEPTDAVLASQLLGDSAVVPFRVGQGYDSHRLIEGRPLMLGGVEIPFEKGLDGHSDADVLLHAVTDAVLGAAGLGDIGRHFPPSEMKWKGADSAVLLAEIVRLAREKGWQVVNCDATVIAERPKIGPHVPRMEARLAQLLGVSAEEVNVKAKTNEKMDAVGREEGMMAQAVVLMTRVPD